MEIYFKAVASYTKEEEDSKGNPKLVKHKDTYLVQAIENYSDAEVRTTEALATIGGSNNVVINTLTKSNIQNVYNQFDGDKLYEVQLTLHWEDDKGNQKKDSHNDLVSANNIKEAIANIESKYDDSIDDYEVTKAQESKILDVFNIQYMTDED